MSKQLNLWLPSQACTAPLAEDLAVPNVRLMELERRQQLRHQVEPDSVNLVGLPTEGRVVLVSKGIWQYRLTLAEAATTEQVLSALWPTHREYQVGQKAPEFLRKTFLPGLNIYCCTGTKDSYLIEARMAPTATEAEADAEIRQKLASAGLTPLELTLCRQVQPPYRSHLAAEALEALVRTCMELTGRGPNLEWYQVANPLAELDLPNAFAYGSGPLPGSMGPEVQEAQLEGFLLDEAFVQFILTFARTLSNFDGG